MAKGIAFLLERAAGERGEGLLLEQNALLGDPGAALFVRSGPLANRSRGGAGQGSEFHDGLVELAGMFRVDVLLQQLHDSFSAGLARCQFEDAVQAAHDPDNVAVHYRVAKAVGKRGDGGCRIVSDAWQVPDQAVVGGKSVVVFFMDNDGGFVQVSCP